MPQNQGNMARAGDVGEQETSDDSISLTSTISSANADRYEVECILAERNMKGGMKYLTAWTDYPEYCHSWEPRECFFEDDVFSEWTRTKMRITQGLEKPFDVKAWRKRCKAVKEETLIRRERRREKKLRLSKQYELTSGPGEQDANIESSGSEPAPRRSDKRIKRRSVHQDSPPSSSISGPPSSSGSEDSDRPLISRQESEISTPNSKWTQTETIALEEGLRTLKGPRWRELLGLFGRNGTLSQVLKDKNASDLYDKAKSIRKEFVDSGREPPEYLKPFSKSASSKGSGTATPNVYTESRGQSKVASKNSSRSTSTDSKMAELHEKQQIREAKNREKIRPQQAPNSTEILHASIGRAKESNTVEAPSRCEPKALPASQAPARDIGVVFAKKPIEETPKAAQSKSHSENAVPLIKGAIEVQENSKHDSLQGKPPKDKARTKEPSKISAVPQAEFQSKSLAPRAKETAEPTKIATAQPGSSRTNVPENKQTMREETARISWSGTARAPTAGPSVSKSSPLGAVGSGPARLSSSKLKPKLGQIEPKKPSVTGDVTAAWNAEPKKRKSNNWATINADPVDGQAPNRSYKLSVQNKIYKSRRDGRAPDPNRLVFIDPKTGKAPTVVPAPSPTAMLSKTPLQLHLEELATKEAQEVEDVMLLGTDEPDPAQGSIDQNRKLRVDEQGVPGTDRSILNASASALRPTAGVMIDASAHKNSRTPPSSAFLHSHTLSDIPLGPRAETKRTATMTLQDYTKRTSSSHPLDEANINLHRSDSSDGPSIFTLRSHPSREHQDEMFKKLETNLVIGDVVLGKDDQERIHVKLVGFGFETKKLLLTVRAYPRTLDFVFETVCLASEYQAYFPAVRP